MGVRTRHGHSSHTLLRRYPTIYQRYTTMTSCESRVNAGKAPNFDRPDRLTRTVSISAFIGSCVWMGRWASRVSKLLPALTPALTPAPAPPRLAPAPPLAP